MSLLVLLANMYEYVENHQDEKQKTFAKHVVSICSEFYLYGKRNCSTNIDKELKYVKLWEKYVKCFPEGSNMIIIYSMFMDTIGIIWYDNPSNFMDYVDELLLGLDKPDVIETLNSEKVLSDYDGDSPNIKLHYEELSKWYDTMFEDCKCVKLVTYCIKIKNILNDKNIPIEMLDDIYNIIINMFMGSPDDYRDPNYVPICTIEEKNLESEFIDFYKKMTDLYPNITIYEKYQMIAKEHDKDHVRFYENLSNCKLLETINNNQ